MLGPRLREIRTRLDLTQAELAERLATAPNTVARWERGEIPIAESTSRLVCALFVLLQRERARGAVIRDELGGRRTGSTDRDRVMRAADQAERKALRDLTQLLDSDALAWWRDDGEEVMRKVKH